jgi:hypothetical protein
MKSKGPALDNNPIPIRLFFNEEKYNFFEFRNCLQLRKDTIVPIRDIITPKYITACGGEKKVSGLLSKWFVMSQLPPTVTSKIPKLVKIDPMRKMYSELAFRQSFMIFVFELAILLIIPYNVLRIHTD